MDEDYDRMLEQVYKEGKLQIKLNKKVAGNAQLVYEETIGNLAALKAITTDTTLIDYILRNPT